MSLVTSIALTKEEAGLSDISMISLKAKYTMASPIPHKSNLKVTAILLGDQLKSQKQAYVSQGRICWDNCTCCHTWMEVTDQTRFSLIVNWLWANQGLAMTQ